MLSGGNESMYHSCFLTSFNLLAGESSTSLQMTQDFLWTTTLLKVINTLILWILTLQGIPNQNIHHMLSVGSGILGYI